MNKKSLMVGALMLSSLIVAGCFGTKNNDNKDEFSVAACNDYVKLMRCVADKSGDSSIEANAVIDQAVTAWKNLPESELSNVCSLALETAASYKSTYEEKGCEVPNTENIVDKNIVDEKNSSGQESANQADQTVINSISGETDASATGIVVPSTGTEETQADSEVVNTVVNEVTTGKS